MLKGASLHNKDVDWNNVKHDLGLFQPRFVTHTVSTVDNIFTSDEALEVERTRLVCQNSVEFYRPRSIVVPVAIQSHCILAIRASQT